MKLVTRKVTIETLHPPYPIYATDTFIHNDSLLARLHSAKSSYEVEIYRRYTGQLNLLRVGKIHFALSLTRETRILRAVGTAINIDFVFIQFSLNIY